MEQQCQVAEVSRAGFYRHLQQTAPKEADLLLRARLQELAVAHHRLRGYRMHDDGAKARTSQEGGHRRDAVRNCVPSLRTQARRRDSRGHLL